MEIETKTTSIAQRPIVEHQHLVPNDRLICIDTQAVMAQRRHRREHGEIGFLLQKKRSAEDIHSVKIPLFNASTLTYTEDENPIYSTLAKQKSIEAFHQCLLSHIESLGFTLFQIVHFEREKMAKKNKKDWFEITQGVLSESTPTQTSAARLFKSLQ